MDTDAATKDDNIDDIDDSDDIDNACDTMVLLGIPGAKTDWMHRRHALFWKILVVKSIRFSSRMEWHPFLEVVACMAYPMII